MTDLMLERLRRSVELTRPRTYLCVGCGKEWNGLELVPLKLGQLTARDLVPPDGGCPECGNKVYRNVLGEILEGL